MSDVTHTLGPWEVRRWGTNDDAWPINRVSIGTVGPRGRAIVISPKYADVEDEANYHLIAAAPDLLEALERLLHSYALLAGHKPVRDMAETLGEVHHAIAKAKGTR